MPRMMAGTSACVYVFDPAVWWTKPTRIVPYSGFARRRASSAPHWARVYTAGRDPEAWALAGGCCPTVASAGDVPGSTRSSARSCGAAAAVSTRSCTPSEGSTMSGSVPPRSWAASAVPGSGAWLASEWTSCHPLQVPAWRVRTRAVRSAAALPRQVTPRTRKRAVERSGVIATTRVGAEVTEGPSAAAGTLGARASAAVSTPETAIDVRCEGTGRGADPEGVSTGTVPTTPTARAAALRRARERVRGLAVRMAGPPGRGSGNGTGHIRASVPPVTLLTESIPSPYLSLRHDGGDGLSGHPLRCVCRGRPAPARGQALSAARDR